MTAAEIIRLCDRLRREVEDSIDVDRLAFKVTPEEWAAMLGSSHSRSRGPAELVTRQTVMGVELVKMPSQPTGFDQNGEG